MKVYLMHHNGGNQLVLIVRHANIHLNY